MYKFKFNINIYLIKIEMDEKELRQQIKIIIMNIRGVKYCYINFNLKLKRPIFYYFILY